MARYKNGQIPASMLVQVGTPTQITTAATAQRWRNFVADAQRTYGWTPRITLGENAYRDYPTQVRTRAWACNQGNCGLAAFPGTSSHGGEFNGADAMAFDVGNWEAVGKAKFYELARRNGFTPNVFAHEPWHIIDYNPYTMPSGGTPAGGTDDFMSALSPAQQAQMYDALVKHGPSGDYYTPDAIINIVREETNKAIASIAAGNINFPGANYNAFVAIVNTIREGNGQPALDIDEAALAKNLAPALAPLLLSEGFGSVDDETVARIAKAAADEQAKRLTN